MLLHGLATHRHIFHGQSVTVTHGHIWLKCQVASVQQCINSNVMHPTLCYLSLSLNLICAIYSIYMNRHFIAEKWPHSTLKAVFLSTMQNSFEVGLTSSFCQPQGDSEGQTLIDKLCCCFLLELAKVVLSPFCVAQWMK